MPQYESEHHSGLRWLSKIAYFFIIPTVFTALLTFVLLSIFDDSVMHAVLNTANRIPVIKQILPETNAYAATGEKQGTEEVDRLNDQIKQLEAEIIELEQKVQQQEMELTKTYTHLDETQIQLMAMREESEQKKQAKIQSEQRLRQLAHLYGDMVPRKAANILEEFTASERALILQMMIPDQQGAILEKMDATMAAETSILMKDAHSLEALEVAATQERAVKSELTSSASTTGLTSAELAAIFAQMRPQSAANVLSELYANDQEKTIRVLRAMVPAARSEVLSIIAEESKQKAADMLSQLGG